MISEIVEPPENVIGYKAMGTNTASDYLRLEPEVKALVEKVRNISMLIDLRSSNGKKWKHAYKI